MTRWKLLRNDWKSIGLGYSSDKVIQGERRLFVLSDKGSVAEVNEKIF